ncbi:MAG: threonine/serine dehydratase [Pseudomonadota bacterium]
MPDLPISFEDIEAAAERIAEHAVSTPLITHPKLVARGYGKVLIKPECLQRTGSFKFRGAFNRLAALDDGQRAAGVVAWSSGNHAQGIAAAAELLGVRAAIVMPEDAPKVKLAKTAEYGAEIVLYDRYKESREDIGRRLAESRGAVLVPSYDDPHIIAGQGTTGLEMVLQTRRAGARLDAVLVCCGGGGLTAGVATAVKAVSPETNIYTVEPAGFDDHARSFRSGTIQRIDGQARSICDALLAPEPGEMTFAINRELVSGGLVVSDDEVREAMRFAFSELKLVVEPGGAVALAAVLSGKLEATDTVGVIISGGNVDPSLFAQILGSKES